MSVSEPTFFLPWCRGMQVAEDSMIIFGRPVIFTELRWGRGQVGHGRYGMAPLETTLLTDFGSLG
ncbi:hypothetical protein ABZV29_42105 [Streptomyces sp. NPDC005236]|uniref:hypothetical protein n=1 Tax=Streptomyces sp. NPDC005236 TaxID=3157028 RepID=UPI0033A4578E